MADELKVASVGLGWWGKELARAARDCGRLRLVSCFARTAEADGTRLQIWDCFASANQQWTLPA